MSVETYWHEPASQPHANLGAAGAPVLHYFGWTLLVVESWSRSKKVALLNSAIHSRMQNFAGS